MCLISFLSNKGSVRVEILCYDGNPRAETLIDWLGEIDSYFEYESVQDPNHVHFSIMKLKGHAALWWDMLQKDLVDNILEKIKTWKNMVIKIKEKFLPIDYQQNLCRQLQNLRQKEISVHEYTEEFFKLLLRSGIKELEYQRMKRYVNNMKYHIQDEMSTCYFHNVDEVYQVALKVEENIDKILREKFQGEGTRGRGRTSVIKYSEKEDEATNNQNTRGGRSVGKGIGFGRGKYVITCYRCGVEGHKASECLEKQNTVRRNEARMQVTQKDETTIVGGNVGVIHQEQGENMMLRRVFKTKCKIQDKCCHLVIDDENTKNWYPMK
jgi:hypothetical protein